MPRTSYKTQIVHLGKETDSTRAPTLRSSKETLKTKSVLLFTGKVRVSESEASHVDV